MEIENHKLIAGLQENLTEFDKVTKPTDAKKLIDHAHSRNDILSRLEFLSERESSFIDPGPIFDCIVFHDGQNWQSVIDTNENGNLLKTDPLASYNVGFEYRNFGLEFMLNYSVNIYDEGDLLSIVTNVGSHGTHVAAIAAANFPGSPDSNGVAPGAQIVSLKVGDARMNSMESGLALMRALTEVCRLKCDLANLSYGDPTSANGIGPLDDILKNHVVNKSRCVFVSSAGNDGPALSTVSAPAALTDSIISVGAYVGHSLMDSSYAMLEKVPEQIFTWSSVGPLSNGSAGVHILAPGGAITSVPQYQLYPNQLMNGTSMASPNCCGCLSLLVSGMKAEGVEVNPYRLKKALVNSAKIVETSEFNLGLVQVEDAWDFLTKVGQNANFDVLYEVGFPQIGKGKGGLYFRNEEDCLQAQEKQCSISPKFIRHEEWEENPKKLQFEAHLHLLTSQKWIKVPEFLHITSGGRSFPINIDTPSLSPGLHYGEVFAFDSTLMGNGPLFKIPITVCKPATLSLGGSMEKLEGLEFMPGDIKRHFHVVPAGANFVEFILSSKAKEIPVTFLIRLTQIQNQTRYDNFNSWATVKLDSPLSKNTEEKFVYKKVVPVIPGVMLDLTLAQFWNSSGSSLVDVEMRYHGIEIKTSGSVNGTDSSLAGIGDGVILNSGSLGFTRVDMVAPIRKEEINVGVKLDTLRQFYRPIDLGKISALKSRDVLPNSKQMFELNLTYEFKIDISCKITPRFPLFNGCLYDSVFTDFEMKLFDSNKCSKKYLNVYTEKFEIDQGTYTLKTKILSTSIEMLQKHRSLIFVLDSSLPKSINLNIFNTVGEVHLNSKSTYSKTELSRGQSTTFWVGSVGQDSYPKNSKFGDHLIGEMTVVGKSINFKKGGGFKVAYIVPPEKIAKDEKSTLPNFTALTDVDYSEKKKEEPELMKEAIRDLEIKWLTKLEVAESDLLFKKLETENPTHIPLFRKRMDISLEKLTKLVPKDGVSTVELTKDVEVSTAELTKDVDLMADKILSLIDQQLVAIYFGTKHDSTTEKGLKEKKDMDSNKVETLAAYLAKAYTQRITIENLIKTNAKSLADLETELGSFDATMVEALKWIDGVATTTNGEYLLLWAWRQRQKGLLGSVLKALTAFLGDVKNLNAEKRICEELVGVKESLVKELGWTFWEKNIETWKIKNFPKDFYF